MIAARPTSWKAMFWVKKSEPALAEVLGYCVPITNAHRMLVLEQQQALQDIIKFNMKSSPIGIAHSAFNKMQQYGPLGQITGGGLYVLAALCDDNLDGTFEAISPHLANTMRAIRPFKDSIQQWAGIIAAGGSLATMPAMFENAGYHRSPSGLAAATGISAVLFKMMTHPDQAGELGKIVNLSNYVWNLVRNMSECDRTIPRHKEVFVGTIAENVLAILPTTLFFLNKEAKRFFKHGIEPLGEYIEGKAAVANQNAQKNHTIFAKTSAAVAAIARSMGKDFKNIVFPQRIHTYHKSDEAEVKYITDAAKFSAAINACAIISAVIAHTTNHPVAITTAQVFALSTAVATAVQGRAKQLPEWLLAGVLGGVGQASLIGGAEASGLAATFLSYYLFSKGNAEMLGKQAKDARG
jgi:hypothetical protein